MGLRSSITVSARILSQFNAVLNEMLPKIVNVVSAGHESESDNGGKEIKQEPSA